jgi:WD40 repeat protein
MCRYILLYIIILLIFNIGLTSGESLGSVPRGAITASVSLDDIRATVEDKMNLTDPLLANSALTLAAEYPGEYNINQVCNIYNSLINNWYYYSDPRKDYFQSANETLGNGRIANTIGMGDSDDFGILISSLIVSLGGSTRIIFTYDMQNHTAHSYSEVYLGQKGDPQVNKSLNWIRDEYLMNEIPGIDYAGNEVWLNLDWGAGHPGGPYFGNKTQRNEVIWESSIKVSPKVLPIIDEMDNTISWLSEKSNNNSNISITTVPAKRGNGIQISFDLKPGGWAGIKKVINSQILEDVTGFDIYVFVSGHNNSFNLRFIYDDGTIFGATIHNAEIKNETWSIYSVQNDDLQCQSLNCDSNIEFNASRVRWVEFMISNDQENASSQGFLVLDRIQGIIAASAGSPWAKVEGERETSIAKDLAFQSESILNEPSGSIKGSMLAIESLHHSETLEGDRALRLGLALLPKVINQKAKDSSINSVSFGPDSKMLAVASGKSIELWDVQKNTLYFNKTYNDVVQKATFNPLAKQISVAVGRSTRILDSLSGEEIHKLNHGDTVDAIAYSPNGDLIAIATGSMVELWDTQNWKKISHLVQENAINDLDFSPNGLILAAATDKNVRIWDVSNLDQLASFYHDDTVTALSFGPDGEELATASVDGNATLWYLGTESKLKSHKSFSKWEQYLQPDDNMTMQSANNNIQRMNPDLLRRFNNGGAVTDVAFVPEGSSIVTSSMDGSIRVWDTQTGEELNRLDCETSVEAMDISPDLRLVAAARGKIISIWDVEAGPELQSFNHDARVLAFSQSSDGRKLATASDDGTVRIWDIEIQRELARMEHSSKVNAVSFSPNNDMLATGSSDNTARLWDAETGQELQKLLYDAEVVDIAFSPDGLKMAIASWDHTASIWDTQTGKELASMRLDDILSSVNFNPDGTILVTVGRDNSARLWDVATGQEKNRMTHDSRVNSAAFSPDGAKVATASDDNTARIWDVSTGQELFKLPHEGPVYSAEFSPDGQMVATAGSDNVARLWDVKSGQELCKLPHDDPVYSTAFSYDGKLLATAAYKIIKIWDIQNGSEIHRLDHDDAVTSMAFDQKGRLIVATGSAIKIWPISVNDLVCEACRRLNYNIIKKDWQEQHCSACDISGIRSEKSILPRIAMSINSVPQGAIIIIDGEFIGKTPYLAYFVKPGEKVIEIKKEGYKDKRLFIEISEKMSAETYQELMRTLYIELVPED